VGDLPLEPRRAGFICKACGKVCDSSRAYKEHLLKHKKLKSSLELIKKRKGPVARDGFKLSCKFCQKKFSKPSQVIRHERWLVCTALHCILQQHV
jgi:hypothetical protein